MSEDLEFEAGSGNVFADLALPDADELHVKAGLVHKIRTVMRERTLTQAAAARILGITQPDVSNMMRGRLDRVSVDRLMQHLVSLGCEVEIVVRSAGGSDEAPRLRVA